jgi:8-oxo-dGTP pyrophosphatase MutT (NUDIX family)
MDLPADARREVDELARRYGEPRRLDANIHDGFDDPIRRKDRFGEVLMAVRRPNGKLLVAIKTFYPRGAYRLPTGGIHHGESIYDALVRETKEETGLDTAVRRFLAAIAYRARSSPGAPPSSTPSRSCSRSSAGLSARSTRKSRSKTGARWRRRSCAHRRVSWST